MIMIYVVGLPLNTKIKNGWSKYILRLAVKGLVPETIRWRKDKMGFATPEKIWLYEQRKFIRKIVFDRTPYFVDKKLLEKYFETISENINSIGFSDLW